MAIELKIPQAGESITEVQIGTWLKREGDFVRADKMVVEIETDKASMELPAPASGRIAKLHKQAGDIAHIGETICTIDEAAAPAEAPPPAAAAPKPKPARHVDGQKPPAEPARAAVAAPPEPPPPPAGEPRIMPAARRALAERHLSPDEVTPSGPGGRLLKEDVERAAAAPPAEAAPPRPPAAPAAAPAPADLEEAVPMSMLRRRIAERLVESQRTAALLTTFNEIDMDAVLRLRKQRGEAFEQRYGIKLGFMSFFVKAAIDALRQFPAVNAEIRALPGSDGRPQPHIVYKNHYDIGVAVSTPQGLVVPVVRQAERLSFAEIERAIADLAARARDRKLALEELQGGTFTISNGGVFGSLLSTPIVNPPQSAILGLHAIQERPVARDGQVVIRPMMYVALTYDHRIIDGRESVTFLRRIKDCVEDPARMLIET